MTAARFRWTVITLLGSALLLVVATCTLLSGTPAQAQDTAEYIMEPAPIYAGPADGRPTIGQMLPYVTGPDSCTTAGDPLSPTGAGYRYRIEIPADYPHDVVRVELFDPDAINQITNTHTISHTAADGRSPTSATCANPARQDSCLLPTGEEDTPLQNARWLVRVDENRGSATPGTCGRPDIYTPAYNTRTHFRLFHYRDDGSGGRVPVPLAGYTGQTGDGVRDGGDHRTDLHWVAPGGASAPGQPAPVPTTCGSTTGGDYDPVTCPQGTPPGNGRGFEIRLSDHLSDTLIAADGSRSLYLEVTGLDGAAHNGFALWAGPPTYTTTLNSEVNRRHLQLADAPNRYGTDGVQIWAERMAPQRALYTGTATIPLTYVGPKYGGHLLTVSLFDPDDGSHPALYFSLDTLVPPDYYHTFGAGADPAGRCFDGGSGYDAACDNLWVTPAYTVSLPALVPAADNPVAFYGGNLFVHYTAGAGDQLTWQVERPVLASLATENVTCMPFPLTPPDSVYSLYPSDATVSDPYQTFPSNLFYPSSLTYTSDDTSAFWRNIPGVSITEARPGYLYLLREDPIDGFSWLAWDGNSSSLALEASLTYPGNLSTLIPPPPGMVNYDNPHDPYVDSTNPELKDLVPNAGDWIQGATGNMSLLHPLLNAYVDSGRVLRLPIHDDFEAIGSAVNLRASAFGLFRLLGYQDSGSSKSLLVEFVRWDDVCAEGVPATPAPACSTGGDCFQFDYLGASDNGDGTTSLSLRIWNLCAQDVTTVALESALSPRETPVDGSRYPGKLGTYGVVWTDHQGNPGFPAVKFVPDFAGYSQGASDRFSITLAEFDPAVPLRLQAQAGATTETYAILPGNSSCRATGGVSGTVRSATEQPAAAIKLSAYWQDGNGQWRWLQDTASADDATYGYGTLPAGRYRLHYRDPSATYADVSSGDTLTFTDALSLSVSTGLTTSAPTATLAQNPAPLIEVSGSAGQRIDNATGAVYITAWNGSSLTISDTVTCSGDLVPAAVTLWAGSNGIPMTASGDDLYSVTLNIPGDLPVGEYPLAVVADCGAIEATGTNSGNVGSLLVRAEASGQVRDATSGLPVPGVRLNAYWVPGWHPRSKPFDSRLNTCESVAGLDSGATWDQVAPTGLGLSPLPELASTPTFTPAVSLQYAGSDGRYLWQVEPDACWYVVANAPGYETTTSPVVGGPDIANHDLTLQPLPPATCATPATISRRAMDVTLTWKGGQGQEVWRSPLPYFHPGDAGTAATFTAGNDYTERELLDNAPFSRYYRVVPAAEPPDTHCQPPGVFSFLLQGP